MKVVIAIDGEECANTALEYVLGNKYNKDTQFYLVHVISPVFADVHVEGIPDVTEEEKEEEQQVLTKLSNSLQDKLGTRVKTDIIRGDISQVIAAACKRFEADEVIVPSHARHGFNRLWFGSVADDIVDATPCTAIVLKMHQQHKTD